MVVKKKVVMVIDDDPDFCSLVSAVLENIGMTVNSFDNLASARLALTETIPHIILLDLSLGNEHGIQFLKERALNPVWASIPVIVCSSEKVANVIKEAIRYGADDYLLKPFKQTWLIQRVRKMLLKENELTHYFEPGEEVDLLIDAESILFKDTLFAARSSVRFEKGVPVLVTMNPTNDDRPVISCFKTEDKSRYHAPSSFDTIFKLSEITEDEKNRIKILKTFWKF